MSRTHAHAVVVDRDEVAEGIYRLSLRCSEIVPSVRAGQFVDLRIRDDGWDPLLRRPFSVSWVEDDRLDLIFNVVGVGTRAMSAYEPGRVVDLLGPLGKPFSTDADYTTALLVGGGLGVAPLPILTEEAKRAGRSVVTFLGARSRRHLYRERLTELHVATDDGSEGFRGTVVDLLDAYLRDRRVTSPMIFACGPTPMLRALGEFARTHNIPCELSLEGEMACGIGLCQGCPVERVGGSKRYALVCTEGPTFRAEEVKL